MHGSHPTAATIEGVGHGARVVTAAALIMAAVFGGFVLVDDPIIKTIGFGLAVGVLIDAFVVRMTLVPAVLTLIGRRAWAFPRWLDRITPRVDIEGSSRVPKKSPSRAGDGSQITALSKRPSALTSGPQMAGRSTRRFDALLVHPVRFAGRFISSSFRGSVAVFLR